jgi:hypothetical protein
VGEVVNRVAGRVIAQEALGGGAVAAAPDAFSEHQRERGDDLAERALGQARVASDGVAHRADGKPATDPVGHLDLLDLVHTARDDRDTVRCIGHDLVSLPDCAGLA